MFESSSVFGYLRFVSEAVFGMGKVVVWVVLVGGFLSSFRFRRVFGYSDW